jgi:glycosyltransferase involved in cell wall biosynthesis
MKTPLTILHTESHIEWGGQERRVFTECRWMKEKGHRVILVTPKRSRLYQKATSQNWELYSMDFRNHTLPIDFFRLRSILKAIRPDVVNTHGNTDSKVALTAAYGLGIPCVIRSRHNSHPVANKWHNRILYQKLNRYIFTTANCISRQLVQDLGVSPDSVYTIASGIEVPKDLPDHEQARSLIVSELGLNSESRFIGCVSRLEDGKGHDSIIDAFYKIKGLFPNHYVLLIGEGRYGAELKKRAGTENGKRIRFLGYRDNPWPYFKAFDVHILVSTKNEGIPQVMLQAMFCGCPVIGADSGGIPDIITHNETGLIVPPRDPEKLAEAVRITLSDKKEATARAKRAFSYVTANYTLDRMGERILNLYRQALS